MNKFLGYAMIILFMAGSICGIVFGIMYKNTNDKYQELNNQDTQLYIIQLEETVDNLTIQVETLQGNIEELTIQLDDKEEQIATDAEKIAEYETQIEEYQITINTLNETVESLQTQISTLQKDLGESNALVIDLQSQVASLQDTVSSLQDTVKYYEELIESYNFEGQSIVTFKVNNNNYDVVVTDSDSAFDHYVEDPKLLGQEFIGWSIDGENVIELQGAFFPEDITLIALFEETNQTYSVNSYVRNYITSSILVDYKFNMYIDITGTRVNNVELKLYDLSNLIDIDESLNNFTTINESTISIEVPMKYIVENYNNETESFKLVYSIIDNELILTEFYYKPLNANESYHAEIKTTKEVNYKSNLVLKEYEVTRTNSSGSELYRVVVSGNGGEIEIKYNDEILSYTKSTSNIYFVNSTINDINICFSFAVKIDNTIEILVFDSVNGGGIVVEEVV